MKKNAICVIFFASLVFLSCSDLIEDNDLNPRTKWTTEEDEFGIVLLKDGMKKAKICFDGTVSKNASAHSVQVLPIFGKESSQEGIIIDRYETSEDGDSLSVDIYSESYLPATGNIFVSEEESGLLICVDIVISKENTEAIPKNITYLSVKFPDVSFFQIGEFFDSPSAFKFPLKPEDGKKFGVYTGQESVLVQMDNGAEVRINLDEDGFDVENVGKIFKNYGFSILLK